MPRLQPSRGLMTMPTGSEDGWEKVAQFVWEWIEGQAV